MASKRELVAENKRILLRGLRETLQRHRSSYGPHATLACDQLEAEFARRACLEPEGPPPGHKPLPGLEVTDDSTT
jgi:hypothetical protein